MSALDIIAEHAQSIETIVYKKVKGVDIKAEIYLPKQDSPGLPPCVYYMHGGGFILGDRTTIYPFQIAEKLRRGWAVVSPEYRLAPNAAIKDMYEDMADGYSWIRRELNNKVDVNRIAVWGHSAGGTLAKAAGYILYPRPKVLVSFYGISDFTIGYNSDPNQPTPESSMLAEQVMAGYAVSLDDFEPDINNPKARTQEPRPLLFQDAFQTGKFAEIVMQSKDIKVIRRYSPINNLGMDYPPIYLVHGDGDRLVPYENSVGFAEVAKEKGIPCELNIIQGGLHGFDFMIRPKVGDDWNKFVGPVFNFVEKYL